MRGDSFIRFRTSKLKLGVKEALEEVFMRWTVQRLPHRTKQEIEKMLIGELPELVETRAGRDILEIGKRQGLAEDVVLLLERKRGRLTKALRQQIQNLTNDQLCQLLVEAELASKDGHVDFAGLRHAVAPSP